MLLASLAPVQVGPGMQGVVLVAHDVTPLRRAMEAVQEASRAKSAFLANMSHDLKSPLNSIIGFSELLLSKSFGQLNETQEEYLDDVYQSSRHLLEVINDILDLSKVEAGKTELTLSEVNLAAVFGQVMSYNDSRWSTFWARQSSSLTNPVAESRAESLSMAINSLPVGGIMRRNAWGRTTRFISWP